MKLTQVLKREKAVFMTIFLALAAQNAQAAGGGLNGVKSIFDQVINMLDTIAVVVVTLAIIVAGYKIVFGGRTIQEVAPILIGGVIIGGATYFAKLILGK